MKKLILIIFLMCSALLGACQVQEGELALSQEAYRRSEILLDTSCQITVYHSGRRAEQAVDQAFDYIEKMDQLFSLYHEGSDINRINNQAGHGPVRVEKESFELIEYALSYSQAHPDDFNITIGPVSSLWDFSGKSQTIPPDPKIQEALQLVDPHQVRLDPDQQTGELLEKGMKLDLGGVAKGYIAGQVADRLQEAGVTTGIINLGGQVELIGQAPHRDGTWQIGIQNPFEVSGDLVGTIDTSASSIVSSGIYQRYFEKNGHIYHHILDPETGYPVDNQLSAVTLVSDDPMMADLLSTALFIMGLEDGLAYVEKQANLEAVFITRNQEVYLSSGLDSFELMDENYKLVNATK